jgi:cation:H+ antiporter
MTMKELASTYSTRANDMLRRAQTHFGSNYASLRAAFPVVIIGLLYRPATRLLKSVGWVSLFLFSVYLLNSYVLYLHGK